MTHQLYELDVRLRAIEPPIWRTLQLPASASLEDLHLAIQVAMGWTNSHLHQFKIGETFYGATGLDAEGGPPAKDERKHRLCDVVREGARFLYEYDFGDDWEHDVVVTRVTTATKAPRPKCIAGARACPPEDCGGPGGYENLLAVLADPRHEQHHDAMSWADDFQPEAFTLPKAGRDLSRDMARLRELALPPENGGALDAMAEVPRALIEAAIELPPMQRAALIAVLAGSLAEELDHAAALLDQVAQRLPAARTPPRRHGRGRSRK